jgi:hypothetical protein
MRKKVISEELKRIHEIMGIKQKSIISEIKAGGWLSELFEKIGISSEEFFEKLKNISSAQADEIIEKMRSIGDDFLITDAEKTFAIQVVRHLLPEVCSKIVTNIEEKFKPSTLKVIYKAMMNPELTIREIRNNIEKGTGVKLTDEAVTIWRDELTNTAGEMKLPDKPIEFSWTPSDVKLNTNGPEIVWDTATKTIADETDNIITSMIGKEAKDDIDGLLGNNPAIINDEELNNAMKECAKRLLEADTRLKELTKASLGRRLTTEEQAEVVRLNILKEELIKVQKQNQLIDKQLLSLDKDIESKDIQNQGSRNQNTHTSNMNKETEKQAEIKTTNDLSDSGLKTTGNNIQKWSLRKKAFVATLSGLALASTLGIGMYVEYNIITDRNKAIQITNEIGKGVRNQVEGLYNIGKVAVTDKKTPVDSTNNPNDTNAPSSGSGVKKGSMN